MSCRPIPNEIKKQMQRPLIKHTDMNSEMASEVVDFIVGGIDKFSGVEGVNMEAASKLIKETLDKQYGMQWHVSMGKGSRSTSHPRMAPSCTVSTRATLPSWPSSAE